MSRDEIKEKLSFLNRDIPETVYQLFEWKTGRRYEDEKPPYMLHSLCPLVEFYTLDDCIELYKIKRDFGVDKKYFPLFYNIGMDVWYIDLEDGAKSKVFFYNPGITLSEDPMTVYDSLENMFYSTLKAIEEGIYTYDKGWNIDPRQFEFFHKLNPSSLYWDTDKRYEGDDPDDFEFFDDWNESEK